MGTRAGPRAEEKSLGTAYLLCIVPLTGLLGAHHYYLGRVGFGLLYTFTLGVLGVGWCIDLLRLSCLVNDLNRDAADGRPHLKQRRRVDDAYICWFPLGLFGFHHFYLKRTCWGVWYLCTFGIFGIGWIIDLCRMPGLVLAYNRKVASQVPAAVQHVSVVVQSGLPTQHGGLGGASYQIGYPGVAQAGVIHGAGYPQTTIPTAYGVQPPPGPGVGFPAQPAQVHVHVAYPPHPGYPPPTYPDTEMPPPYSAISPGDSKAGSSVSSQYVTPSAPNPEYR